MMGTLLLLSEHVTSVGANDGTASLFRPTEAFISQIGGSARQLRSRERPYASVMIAQAILESGSGQSTACLLIHV